MNGEPTRIWNARTRRGDKNYECLAKFLELKAIDIALTNLGLSREMTEERRWGKHIKDHSQLQHDQYRQPVEQELAKRIDEHVRLEDPDCFVNNKDARDKLLALFKIDRTVLKKYPHAVRAMFVTFGESIPEDLYSPEADREMRDE